MAVVGDVSSCGNSGWAEGEHSSDPRRRLRVDQLKSARIASCDQQAIAAVVALAITLSAGGHNALLAGRALTPAGATVAVLTVAMLMLIDHWVYERMITSWAAIQRPVTSVGDLGGGSA
jgi:hypothetical protein